MLRLIIGVKGTGKTKQLIDLVNTASASSNGNVVCLEQGDKLKFDIAHQVRLIDTKEYMVSDAQSLFGFIAGITASNHDITDLFVDSALKICNDKLDEFKKFLSETDRFATINNLNVIMTASLAEEAADAEIKAYIK